MNVEVVPFREEHLSFLEKIWRDPKVNKHTGMPAGGIDMGLWLKQYRTSKGCREFRSEQYIILLDGGPVGETAFGLLPESFMFGNWEKDLERPCALLDIKLLKPHWGKGIATIALREVIDTIFRETSALDIVAIPYRYNRRATKLYRRCGLGPTGRSNSKGNLVYMIRKERWLDGKD